MRLALAAAFLLATSGVAGCSSKVADAERRYQIVLKDGRADEICAQGRALAAAYLEAKDEANYQVRKTTTEIECQSAELREGEGIYRMPDGSDQKIEPDNMLSGN